MSSSTKPKTKTKSGIRNEKTKSANKSKSSSKKDNNANFDNITTDNGETNKKQFQYNKMTLKEHVITLPDTYIGSIEPKISKEYIFDDLNQCIFAKEISLNPGFCNIFEEVLVNAFDQFNRVRHKNKDLKGRNKLKPVTEIRVNINKLSGEISVYNNGEGIAIDIHPKEKVYIPQMIFGELLTSGNYNMKEEKITGGKNGFGAKLTNIFSKYFKIETVDRYKKLKYEQVFRNNLNVKEKHVITEYKREPYTKITYIPDYERFGITGSIPDETIALFKKRVYDIIPCSDGIIDVYFNDKKIDIKTFKDYMSLYVQKKIFVKTPDTRLIPENEEDVSGNDEQMLDEEYDKIIGSDDNFPIIHQKINDRWSIGMCLSPTVGFKQISFVNGINTTRGGRHVDYITKQITSYLVNYIHKKRHIRVKESMIKENIMIFLVSTIVNPSFDSQTKETLTTNKGKFGSECVIPPKLIEELGSSGVISRAINLNSFHEKQLLTKTDGKKKSRLHDIEKLDDAKYAGTRHSKECTLILTEGDSAKVTAVAGVSEIKKGRELYGIYPLRGKLLNTRGENKEKLIASNQEITDLKRILGLQEGKVYTNIDGLRYGKIMIMTDQDVDGSHIKGLIINFIASRWPSLIKIKDFIINFLTPIVKAKHKTIKTKSYNFYNLFDFEEWMKVNENGKKYNIKYYKGLGTSSPKESKEYFKDPKHIIYDYDEMSHEKIDLAFNCKRADDRKSWLSEYDNSNIINTKDLNITYNDFIDKELIHFSNYDNKRSIPSVYDGLKPSQRKILYCCFKRKLVKEIRVAQLAGYVSEHGAYHHGEASLNGAIINMAQNYVGHKNINILEPNGQFGSRLKGGKDSAQPRYIHTCLTKISNIIFDKRDEPIYNYTMDDGDKVEPYFYVPIIPMVLVNGTDGIGTGWSTGVPQFNPIDIVKNLKLLMDGQSPKEMVPYFRGFKGKIKKVSKNSWITKGVYAIKDLSTVIITELPVGVWTDNFKVHLDFMLNNVIGEVKKRGNIITRRGDAVKSKNNFVYLKDYINDSSESQVHFTLKFDKKILNDLLNDIDKDGINKFEKLFKMVGKISCNKKLNLYNQFGKLTTYDSPEEILEDYFELRSSYYIKRREYLINELKKVVLLIKVKVKFILDIINKKIIVNNRSKTNIYEQLEKLDYPKMNNGLLYIKTDKMYKDGDFDYLIRMPIYNLTKERIEELKSELDKVETELSILESKSKFDLWKEDLKEFEREYKIFMTSYYKYMGFNPREIVGSKTKRLIIKDKHL